MSVFASNQSSSLQIFVSLLKWIKIKRTLYSASNYSYDDLCEIMKYKEN